MNAIIIHGTCDKEEYFSDKYPSLSNSHWFPWLQKQLLMKGIFTQTPEMPEAYISDYEKWEKEFERFETNDDTVLIGHSCGAGFLVRWLSENKVNFSKLVLVAPWLDPEREKTDNFFDFQIDGKISERACVHVFLSEDDDAAILKSAGMVIGSMPGVKVHKFSGKGHFTFEDMKTHVFPELLEIILSNN